MRTIDSRAVASTRLRIGRPKSAYFYNRSLGLRVDLLFDFPVPAREVRGRSTRRKIQSYSFHIASTEDLIRMKGRVFARMLRERGIGINPAQGRVLFVLWEEGPTTIHELAKRSGLAKSTLTTTLDRLEAQG